MKKELLFIRLHKAFRAVTGLQDLNGFQLVLELFLFYYTTDYRPFSSLLVFPWLSMTSNRHYWTFVDITSYTSIIYETKCWVDISVRLKTFK